MNAGCKTQAELVRRFADAGYNYSRGHIGAIESGNTLPGDDFLEALNAIIPGAMARLSGLVEASRSHRASAHGRRARVSRPAFHDYLLEELRALFAAGNYPAVVRYGQTFSRFLWVEGHVRARILAGEIVEAAAAKIGDRAAQVACLVDDLGWSSVAIGNHPAARQYLEHGRELAEAEGLPYWLAKAFRHLGGLEVELGNLTRALEYLECARTTAAQIAENLLQKEMLAGTEYGAAVAHFAQRDFDLALQALKKSDGLRVEVGDFSRAVKLHAMYGKIYERQGKPALARESYRRGLDESTAVGRRDEEIRNLLGLSRVLSALGNEEEASNYADRARGLLDETPIPYELLASADALE